jgi:hypothetical protein
MKSEKHGKSTSNAEVLNISPFGIWLLVLGCEYFLPFDEYAWFKKASVSEIYNVELVHNHHLHWPDIDVDLELDSLENLEKYPLKDKA